MPGPAEQRQVPQARAYVAAIGTVGHDQMVTHVRAALKERDAKNSASVAKKALAKVEREKPKFGQVWEPGDIAAARKRALEAANREIAEEARQREEEIARRQGAEVAYADPGKQAEYSRRWNHEHRHQLSWRRRHKHRLDEREREARKRAADPWRERHPEQVAEQHRREREKYARFQRGYCREPVAAGKPMRGENARGNSGSYLGGWDGPHPPADYEGGVVMRNWRPLSLVAVLIAAVFVWHLLPRALQAEEMKVPPGATMKTQEFGTQEIPGVKKVTFNRFQLNPGAKWSNMNSPAKTWAFVYRLSGTMSVKGVDGKVSQAGPGTAFIVAPSSKVPLVFNTGKTPAVNLFWEIELQ